MERIIRGIITVLFLAATASGAVAQQQTPAPRQTPRQDRVAEQREAVIIKMDAVRIARLTETLKLDEKTASAFIPIITALEQKRRGLLKENQEIMREMRLLLNASPPDEAKLKAAISRIDKNRQEIASQRNKEFNAAKSHLTVVQTARYIIFNQEFQQEMRGMLNEARSGRSGKTPPGRGPGGPSKVGNPQENK